MNQNGVPQIIEGGGIVAGGEEAAVVERWNPESHRFDLNIDVKKPRSSVPRIRLDAVVLEPEGGGICSEADLEEI